jgi:hypothetical protein
MPALEFDNRSNHDRGWQNESLAFVIRADDAHDHIRLRTFI